jgi:hypothetical protein
MCHLMGVTPTRGSGTSWVLVLQIKALQTYLLDTQYAYLALCTK